MLHLLKVILFLIFSMLLDSTTVKSINLQCIQNDLTKFNITCTDDDCQNYEEDSLSSRVCHCGMHCVQLGTCCVDSPHAHIAQPKLQFACRSVYQGNSYFMVDQCPSNDSIWASQCNDEGNQDDDVHKIVPVTSISTSITYKNYYCFRCHESTDDFLYWTIKVQSQYALPNISDEESQVSGGHISLMYDKDRESLTAYYDDEIGYIPVISSLEIPSEIMNLTHFCVADVISDCHSEWSDEYVRTKCQSYMAIKKVEKDDRNSVKYKNIHCALCNNENLSDVQCEKTSSIQFGSRHGVGGRYGGGWRYGGHRGGGWRYGGHSAGGRHGAGHNRFTFTYLLDINRSDGEFVGKIQKCSDDQIWDPYSKKCRKLLCALPSFKIRSGRCIQE